MVKNQKARTKKAKRDNPKRGRPKKCQLRRDRRRTIARSSDSPSSQDDSLTQASPHDGAPTSAPDAAKPPKFANSGTLSSPSTPSEQVVGEGPSPPRHLTLDALLQIAKVVETLKVKASVGRAGANDHLKAAKRENTETRDSGTGKSPTHQSGRPSRSGSHPSPHGGPAISPAQAEGEE